ncbi:MAG: hypothetical protein ACREAA_09610 [Candidatus Polarisedimenticolia bacterium]
MMAAQAGRRAALAALMAVAAGAAPRAQDLVRPEDAVVAVFSLQTELEVDARQLERMETRHEENRKARVEARARVQRLYTELDALFGRYRESLRDLRAGVIPPDEGTSEEEGRSGERASITGLEEEIEAKERDLRMAERGEGAIQDEGRRMRDDIRNLRERMTLLAQRIAALQNSLPAQRDSVTGVWDVSLLPSGVTGVFALFQSGTLVSGQYVLEGPFQGSLDGTLIDRRLLLHRIDARLGRSMDLTASLSQDGQALRGTWENYDLANGQTRTGSWSARRREPKRSQDTEGQEGAP